MGASAHEALLTSVYGELVQPVLGVLFVVALVVFFWGVAEFIRGADSEDVRTKGKRHIIYGVIGMAIMISALGVIRVVNTTVGEDDPLPEDIIRG